MAPLRDLDQLNRKMKALLAAAATGAATLVLLQYAVLPKLARDVSPAQRAWLRDAFRTHTGWVLLAIAALAAIFALPVLLVAVWMGGKRKQATKG